MEPEAELPYSSGHPALVLAKVEAMVFRAPIEDPVITSFGVMTSRPSVVIRIEDADGAVGWGEVWCNFPAVGAEHRARLFENVVAPLLLERDWATPLEAFETLSRKLHVLAIQCGEEGPLAQVIAGADVALWDLVGRRLNVPLWQLFAGAAEVTVYASGINPVEPEATAERKRKEGYRAFKLKVGFGLERDIANLRALRDLLGRDVPLMVDANQAWDADTAIRIAPQLTQFELDWLEEPIAADRSAAEWLRVASASPVPLAGGENIRGLASFAEAIEGNALKVIQPDLGKWGGFSGCLRVGRQALEQGKLFCPHWLGGGIGQVASMHLKAAVGGDGYVEVDSNFNPLRELLGNPFPAVSKGKVMLSGAPGLGIEPDIERLRPFLVSF
ncbi:MAG TPA: mandelate racemase/muconate lactonizing enzyme family protein [Bradyrhizobium sp.]|uniref:mandelate racemase/muconate lactonizing enzyme family protein n=1 Tax=Bradyrhizobium sp. TaxID=376 RepID=UPI002CDAB2BB|nr:mandelate racemase/muconate lactonizing enzyme family protein [Bradyrhizobium sp.]HLZ03756.1 mandelate racemase/muconate lactonizing enzyme family protein [Bradyrhizobium sp.]